MPANTVVHMHYCMSLNEFKATIPSATEPDKKYIVRHERLLPNFAEQQGTMYGFTCDCKGYRYRGTCSHIDEVKAAGVYCGWDEMFNTKGKLKPIEEPTLAFAAPQLLCPCCHCKVGTRRELI